MVSGWRAPLFGGAASARGRPNLECDLVVQFFLTCTLTVEPKKDEGDSRCLPVVTTPFPATASIRLTARWRPQRGATAAAAEAEGMLQSGRLCLEPKLVAMLLLLLLLPT